MSGGSESQPVGAASSDGTVADAANDPPDKTDRSAVLTVDEVAALLRLDRKTVYAAVARGEIPGAQRIGRAVRLHRDTVLNWLAQGQGRVSRSRRMR